MKEEERYKIEKEIEFLQTELELYKFHYIRSMSNFKTKTNPLLQLGFIVAIPIYITLLINFFSITNAFGRFILTITMIFIGIGLICIGKDLKKIKRDYAGQVRDYKKDINIINESIKKSYEKLGVNIKEIYGKFREMWNNPKADINQHLGMTNNF